MDIGKVFPGLTINVRNMRSLNLSNRRYARLKESEKKIFDGTKANYTPLIWKLALHIKATLHKPFKAKYFEIASTWVKDGKWDIIETCYAKEYGGYPIIKPKYIIRELEFQGFVDINTYPIKGKYGYFMTNQKIEGIRYIYPKRFADSYNILQKHKYPYFQDYMGNYGIPGIIRYQFSN